MRILEIDLHTHFFRNPLNSAQGTLPRTLPAILRLPFATNNMRLYLESLIEVLNSRDATGVPLSMEVRLRVYNEGTDPFQWARIMHEGTIRPATVIAVNDFSTLAALVSELLFLPHVVVVFRGDDWVALMQREREHYGPA
ncbi:hypothetical protein LTR95_007056, partial [Oleoguttula sp. CCFEE 5521]